MRIVHAHKYHYLRAGAERYMFELMHLQEQDGHQVAPFSMHYPKNIPSPWAKYFVSELETESGASGSIISKTARALWSTEAKKKFTKLLDDFRPDIVHVHNIYTHISPSILSVCKKRHIPVVMSVHDYSLISANYSLWGGKGSLPIKNPGLHKVASSRFIKGSYTATLALEAIYRCQKALGLYQNKINKFLANSEFTRQALIKNGYHEDQIEVFHPFLSAELIEREHHRKKKSVGKRIIYFGRLADYKGVQTLINAAKLLPKEGFQIVGAGPYESELRTLAEGQENIEFLGFIKGTELWEHIEQAKVVVAPSIWHEPFGLSALEAMSLGVPVVAAKSGGLAEIIEDGISGRLFKPGSPQALADALGEIIHNKSVLHSMGESARHRAHELGDPQNHWQNLRKLYTKIKQKHRK